MNKNTTFGLILIFLVLWIFSYLNNNLIQEQNDHISTIKDTLDITKKEFFNSTKQFKSDDINKNLNIYPKEKETFITIQNALIEIKINTKGGYIYSVRLKKYTNYKNEPLYFFEKNESTFNISFISTNNRRLNSNDFYFEKITNSKLQTILRLNVEKNKYIDFFYSIHPNDYMVDFKLIPNNLQTEISPYDVHVLNIQWMQKIRQQEKCRKFEERYARLTYRFLAGDVKQLGETKNDIKNIFNKLQWIGYKDQFFSSVFIAHNNFESTKLNSKHLAYGKYIKEYTTSTDISYNNLKPPKFNFYFGPNDYDLLKNYDKTKLKKQNLELEKLVPLGWNLFRTINKYIIIPLFAWLTNRESMTIGLAIFLLTLIIKTALFPLTYKSFVSSAKIRVLRPQIETINAKYLGKNNALIRQQKTMELYRQVGVNPMSGCLPLILQMPFLIALFMFFPSAISLRHQNFLWTNDLSTYDSLIHWNINIQYISQFLGNHISLFCLLMSLATILNTKITMNQQNSEQEQFSHTKWMMYFMPILMFFFLNSYPAGLNYYYLISTLISIIQTIIFRIFIDENKILEKLESNRKKTKFFRKKPSFIDRLEKIQKKRQMTSKKK